MMERGILKIFLSIMAFLLCVSCAAAPQIAFYKNPNIDSSKYRRIAILKFTSDNAGIGQEVSDYFAIQMMKKGYDVVERSQLKGIIDEATLVGAGLTDSQKAPLLLSGITSLLVGSVSQYNCEQSGSLIPTTLGHVRVNKNLCHVSLSLKALDVKTGNILWAAQCSDSDKGRHATAAKVLSNMIPHVAEQIP